MRKEPRNVQSVTGITRTIKRRRVKLRRRVARVLDEKDIWHLVGGLEGNRLFGRPEIGGKVRIKCAPTEGRVKMYAVAPTL
jgi:hypothetical protein